MILKPVKSAGLAHISYFLGQGSQAAVVDPRRDIDAYVELARRHDMRIRYVFETHRNEDYTIGSLELADCTGAEVYHGNALPFRYGNRVRSGDRFRLGGLEVQAIETPGHTVEHITYGLADHPGEDPVMLFTGDALFVGDVGRVDLYGPEQTARMAGALYDSIFGRLLPLGDGPVVYPAHGSGSVCGGHISEREVSSLGTERQRNPALWNASRDDFIAYKVAEHHYTPPYFHQMEAYNQAGPPRLGRLPEPPPLGPEPFQAQMEAGAIALDTRMPAAYGGAHLPGSYSIWLEGVPSFTGWVLPYDRPVLLVAEGPDEVERAVRYLVRMGYDRLAGHLGGGIMEWIEAAYPTHQLELLTVQELRARLARRDGTLVLDVRRDDEWQEGHIEGAQHIYVGHLEEQIAEVPSDRPVATVCASGRRASLAASILRRAGRSRVANVLGSMSAWEAAGFPTVTE